MECQKCAFNPIVQAISELLKTYTVVIGKKNVPLNAVEYLIHRTKGIDDRRDRKKPEKANKRVSRAAEELLPLFNKLVEFVESEMLPKCQEICRTCSINSNDDNLSRSGQTVISIDAMPGAAGELVDLNSKCERVEEGECRTEEDESIVERMDRAFFEDSEDEEPTIMGNWLNVNAIHHNKDGYGEKVTKLPLGDDDAFRKILASFRDLTTLQQCVLLQRWKEMSFVDIGSMTWVPNEFRHHNDKQLVSFWWRQIVAKFPWADALSGKKRKGVGVRKAITEAEDDYVSHSPSVAYVEQQFDFGSSL